MRVGLGIAFIAWRIILRLFLQAIAAMDLAVPFAFRARDQLAVHEEQPAAVAEGAEHTSIGERRCVSPTCVR